MNGKGFQALVAQLGELSVVQREALIAALKGRLSLDEAIDLIDRRFKAEPCCGPAVPNSSAGGVRRTAWPATAAAIARKPSTR